MAAGDPGGAVHSSMIPVPMHSVESALFHCGISHCLLGCLLKVSLLQGAMHSCQA